jgi:hypothetical protein
LALHRGSAAAQCGKALPFRQLLSQFFGGYASIPRRSLQEDLETGTVRRSLTALCCGKAARAIMITWGDDSERDHEHFKTDDSVDRTFHRYSRRDEHFDIFSAAA